MTDIKTRIAEARAALADALATDCEALMREREELQALLAPARLEGESDADTLRRVFASHRALAEAGEEMPSALGVTSDLYEYFGDDNDASAWKACEDAAGAVLDLFRPLFARLTQERDEAVSRAEHEASNLHAFRVDYDEMAQAHGERATEVVALRQRAERAERELHELHGMILPEQNEGESDVDTLRRLSTETESIRARTADLEAQLAARRVEPTDEPRLRTRAHVALLDWLAIATGTRDGHDLRIVEAMSQLVAPARVEHSADVVQAQHDALDPFAVADASLVPTSPQGSPAEAEAPEGRTEVGDVRKGPPRATVDLSSWPALREVEARGGGVVFLGDDPDGVAEAFAEKVEAARPALPLCLCPATSEYDPPCPRHGTLGIGVTGRD
jgi:hypothetical protein